ncbi:hypothetical protein [Streptomyces sp. NPDC001678]|uniref:hypothetical protein n=1 Tax=Streptomyces sp. NPDC001678 TaxID=3364599 RepID=UPI0036D1F1E4
MVLVGFRVEFPYGTEACQVGRNDKEWAGCHAYVAEACGDGSVDVIREVATVVPAAGIKALRGIHQWLRGRGLLPGEHLVGSGYISAAAIDAAAREHGVEQAGPLPAGG